MQITAQLKLILTQNNRLMDLIQYANLRLRMMEIT